jgi:hypothetical protein
MSSDLIPVSFMLWGCVKDVSYVPSNPSSTEALNFWLHVPKFGQVPSSQNLDNGLPLGQLSCYVRNTYRSHMYRA